MIPLIYGLGIQELFIVSFVLVVFLIPVIAIIDIVSSEFKGYDKIMWVLIVLFLPFAGALIYMVIGRKQKLRTLETNDTTDVLE